MIYFQPLISAMENVCDWYKGIMIVNRNMAIRVEMAKMGRPRSGVLHIVDLDGALASTSKNLDVIQAILEAVDIPSSGRRHPQPRKKWDN